jgi:hypothetical protein
MPRLQASLHPIQVRNWLFTESTSGSGFEASELSAKSTFGPGSGGVARYRTRTTWDVARRAMTRETLPISRLLVPVNPRVPMITRSG